MFLIYVRDITNLWSSDFLDVGFNFIFCTLNIYFNIFVVGLKKW